MRRELGLEPLPDPNERPRDQAGRFAKGDSATGVVGDTKHEVFNQLVRSMAGR
jgi:hypothetical protein